MRVKRAIPIVLAAGIATRLVIVAAPTRALPDSVFSVLSGRSDTSALVTAIKAAGLTSTLSDPSQPVLLFAPTNDVFAEFPAKTLSAYGHNKSSLTQLLTYHIVRISLQAGTFSPTGQQLTTVQGGTIVATTLPVGKTLVDGALVTAPPIRVGRSSIYLIDSLLVPPALRNELTSPRIRIAHNRELARAFVQDLESAHSAKQAFATANTVVATGYIQHNPLVPQGRQGLLAFLSSVSTSFSQNRIVLQDVIAEQDSVVARWTWSGKHTGNFLGYPATNKRFNLGIIDVWNVKDGMLHEHWDELGFAYFLGQLGIYQFPPKPLGPVKGYPAQN